MAKLSQRGHAVTEIILHIGDGKCGSSSIQASLWHSQETLLESGIVYVSPGPGGGHSSFNSLLNVSSRAINSGKLPKIANECIKSINYVVQNNQHDYLILSSEGFFNIPPKNILTLLDRFTFEISGVHVIGYIRAPEAHYVSWMQQRLKANGEISAPEKFVRNFARPFRRWANQSICRSVCPAVFDKNSLFEGSAVRDFNQTLRHITGRRDLVLDEHFANESITAEQMIVMQMLHNKLYPNGVNSFYKEGNDLLRFFTILNSNFGPVGSKARLKMDIKRVIRQANRQNIEKMHSIFPYLMLDQKWLDAEDQNGQKPTWDSRNVGTVLDNVDTDIVEKLVSLIPALNSPKVPIDLKRYKKAAVPFDNIDGERFGAIYRRYLNS